MNNTVNNLSQLKRALVPGAEFIITKHCRLKRIGQHRVVNLANTAGCYSVMKGDPLHEVSRKNNGRGVYMEWGKASNWEFDGDIITAYTSNEHNEKTFILSFHLI